MARILFRKKNLLVRQKLNRIVNSAVLDNSQEQAFTWAVSLISSQEIRRPKKVDGKWRGGKSFRKSVHVFCPKEFLFCTHATVGPFFCFPLQCILYRRVFLNFWSKFFVRSTWRPPSIVDRQGFEAEKKEEKKQ